MIRDPKAQCRANIEAVLRFHRLPSIDVLICDVDRLKAFVPPTFEPALLDSRAFASWNAVKNHGPLAIRGWREEVARESLQVIEHRSGIWEFDIDRWNPNFGVLPGFLHWIEVAVHGKTDPFRVRDGLLKRGVQV